MKKTITTLSAGLLMAGVTQAATTIVDLDLAAAGQYTNADAHEVKTSVSFCGATFNIAYTLSSRGGTNSYVSSDGTYGVGSDTDSQNTTLEGNDGEGIAFLGLSITDFVGSTDIPLITDITNLRFRTFTTNNDGNARDGVNISYVGFGTAPLGNEALSATTGTTTDVTAETNYSPTATGMYLTVDTGQSNNRWGITNLAVSFDSADKPVPEPTSAGLLGLGFAGLLLRRRK